MLDLLGRSVDLLLALLGSTTQTEDQVKSRLLLDVVVREGAAVLELLAGENETLLVRGNALLVCDALGIVAQVSKESLTLDLGLHIVDSVRRLHLKGDRLPGDFCAVSMLQCGKWRLEAMGTYGS